MMNLKKNRRVQVASLSAHWDGTSETEDLIKQETKATIQVYSIEE